MLTIESLHTGGLQMEKFANEFNNGFSKIDNTIADEILKDENCRIERKITPI